MNILCYKDKQKNFYYIMLIIIMNKYIYKVKDKKHISNFFNILKTINSVKSLV